MKGGGNLDSGSFEHTAIHDRVYVGRKLGEFESSPAFEPVTKVILWYDDESSYAAGDDSGRVLELTCPWATQAMAENILASVSGFVYRPFSGTGALLDPAAELGDAVTVNGVYSMLATMDTNFDALCLSDISAPADEEVDHEYPYQSPQGRELRRKVSLEQKYYGTKISRREGLVIEKTDGDSVEARVVLNAEKLAFYDGSGQEQLYFDPAEGVYKFRGALNVNDNFIVDKLGNVTMKGNLNLAEISTIYWGDKPPNKKRYAASTDGPWHDSMQSGDIYCCDWNYTTNQWGDPYKFVGTDGKDGVDGSDASVNRRNVEQALAYAKGLGSSFMAVDTVGSPIIYGGKIYGSEIYAGGVVGSGGVVGTGSVISLTDEGIELRNDTNDTKLEIASALVPGVGTVTALYGGGALLIDSMQTMIGLYMGTSSAIGMQVGPSGTEFAGPVHFSGKVTGVTAVFA